MRLLRRLMLRLSRITLHSPVRMTSKIEQIERQEMVVVSMTHALVDSNRRRDFDRATLELLRQLPQAPGLLMHSVRRELLGDEAWTMTAWRTDGDRMTFITSEAHARAMTAASGSILRMRARMFVLPATELPLRWSVALELLDCGNW